MSSLRYHCLARVFDGASRTFHHGVPTHAQGFAFSLDIHFHTPFDLQDRFTLPLVSMWLSSRTPKGPAFSAPKALIDDLPRIEAYDGLAHKRVEICNVSHQFHAHPSSPSHRYPNVRRRSLCVLHRLSSKPQFPRWGALRHCGETVRISFLRRPTPINKLPYSESASPR